LTNQRRLLYNSGRIFRFFAELGEGGGIALLLDIPEVNTVFGLGGMILGETVSGFSDFSIERMDPLPAAGRRAVAAEPE
jgi:hypothetical protein